MQTSSVNLTFWKESNVTVIVDHLKRTVEAVETLLSLPEIGGFSDITSYRIQPETLENSVTLINKKAPNSLNRPCNMAADWLECKPYNVESSSPIGWQLFMDLCKSFTTTNQCIVCN